MNIFCFIVCDNAPGIFEYVLKILRMMAGSKKNILILDYAGKSGTRAVGTVSKHLEYMDAVTIKGYLSVDGCDNAGALIVDEEMNKADLESLACVYDNCLVLMDVQNLRSHDMFRNVPALLVCRELDIKILSAMNNALNISGSRKNFPEPIAFAIPEKNIVLGSELKKKWKIEFWGQCEDHKKISMQMVKTISETKIKPPADLRKVNSEAMCELVTAIRNEPEFRELKVSAGSPIQQRELKERVQTCARRLVGMTDDREVIVEEAVNNTVGLGPIETLMKDPTVSEIMINGYDKVFIEKDGVVKETDIKFEDDVHLRSIIERMVAHAGRRVDESSPMVDARLPDGSRINVVIPPLSIDGPAVTIRRFVYHAQNRDDMIKDDFISENELKFLTMCVASKISILISGGTGAGKTTLLGLLAQTIDEHERIITIEDSAELILKFKHVVRLESRPAGIEGKGQISIRDLTRNALRMRPSRIIVGECRGAEALDMLQAMNTGHEGSLTTVHANSPRDALARLETMVMMADSHLPLGVVREQIVRAIKIIVQIARMKDGRRRVIEIAEVTGLEGQTPCMQTLAKISEDGLLKSTGLTARFTEKI